MNLRWTPILTVAALACVVVGLLVASPLVGEICWIGAPVMSALAIVVYFIEIRPYDPYRTKRHSPD